MEVGTSRLSPRPSHWLSFSRSRKRSCGTDANENKTEERALLTGKMSDSILFSRKLSSPPSFENLQSLRLANEVLAWYITGLCGETMESIRKICNQHPNPMTGPERGSLSSVELVH